MNRKKLGEILIECGYIDALQLRAALAHQRSWGTRLGRALVEHRFCTWWHVLDALSLQTGLPAVDLDAITCEPQATTLVPRKIAEQHELVPLRLEGARNETLVVAVGGSASLDVVDVVRSVSGKRVRVVLAADDAVERAIGRIYRGERGGTVTALAVASQREQEFELDVPSVWIHGWSAQATDGLTELLTEHGYSVRLGDPLDCSESDVVLAPLPALEKLIPVGRRLAAKVVAAGKDPERDLVRAERVGASGFLLAPVDPAMVLRVLARAMGRDVQTVAA